MTSPSSSAVAAMIVRGPMASDHYTPIHNWILRGGLPAPYVGVYAYIASHREGWRLSEAQIAQDLHKGRHYVRQALTAMEAAGLLVRRQERRADGTYGASMWWVSDLAAQLRSLGVDEETISRRVAEAVDECFRRSAPTSENLTTAVSSENTPLDECLPRSAPKSGFPTSDNRTPKEEQEEEEQEEEQAPPPTSSSQPAAETTQEEEETGTEPKVEEGKPTDADLQDQAAQLLDEVQWPLGGRPSPVDRGRLVKWVAQCLQAGHPDAAVTHELREAMSAQRPVGAAITRLRTLAGMPPRQTDTDRASNPSSTPTTQWEWELPPCEHEMPGGNMPIAPGVLRCPMCRRQAARGGDPVSATQERGDEPAATAVPRPGPSKRASLRGRRATPPRIKREELSEEEFEKRRRTYLAALEAFMRQEATRANPSRPETAVDATNSDTPTDTTPDASRGLLEALRADSGVCVVCGGTNQVATRAEGLVVPTPVCDACWISGVSDAA